MTLRFHVVCISWIIKCLWTVVWGICNCTCLGDGIRGTPYGSLPQTIHILIPKPSVEEHFFSDCQRWLLTYGNFTARLAKKVCFPFFLMSSKFWCHVRTLFLIAPKAGFDLNGGQMTGS
jgi:hypothetical protein